MGKDEDGNRIATATILDLYDGCILAIDSMMMKEIKECQPG